MDLAHLIDHTLLKPTCTFSDVEKTCREAIEHNFAAVCLPPYYVKNAKSLLQDSTVKVATVIGYPSGYATTAAKVEEIKRAVDEEVDELDVVVNLCAVKNGNWNYVKNEMESLTTACHMRGKIIKTIIGAGLLTNEELLKIAEICASVGVDFVNTSTGIEGQGASVEVVSLLRKNLPAKMKIKALGGIQDKQFAEMLIQAGADRLGCSASIQIIAG